MRCLVCNIPTNPMTPKLIGRYGEYQKYCSPKCCKLFWKHNNKEKDKQSKELWLANNPEKRKENSHKYRKKNISYYTEYSSLRTRNAKNAKIKSLNEFDELYLIEFYDLAKRRGLEVDHIIPIKHKRICGLHVPWNLQMLTRSQNAKKNNKFDDARVVAIISKKETND